MMSPAKAGAPARPALRIVRRRGKNSGSFAPGPDPRRHKFTAAERARGGRTRWEQILDCMRRNKGELFPDSGCWGQWMNRLRHKVD